MAKQQVKKTKLRWFKLSGIMEEIRRIRWPKPMEVVKNTGIVLFFTTIFALFFALTNVVLVPLTQLFIK